jgi:hypothetical protein
MPEKLETQDLAQEYVAAWHNRDVNANRQSQGD